MWRQQFISSHLFFDYTEHRRGNNKSMFINVKVGTPFVNKATLQNGTINTVTSTINNNNGKFIC